MAQSSKTSAYYEAKGGRKTAVARVRIALAAKEQFSVNQKPLESYFQDAEIGKICREPLGSAVSGPAFAISVVVKGGGIRAQAEAIRHGLSRALLLWNPELKTTLKSFGYLKRDPRMRERKKFGLRRARRARQWRKR